MSRSYVNKGIQIGVESTPGTAVAANKRLPSLSFNLGPQVDSKQYRGMGFKFNTINQSHKIWSEGNIEGPLSYNEIIYPLATMFTPPTPTTPGGGTNSREWLFTPLAQGNETLKTLTVEQGDSIAAQIAAYVACRGLNFEFAEDDVTVNGPIIGRAPTTGSMTGSPTSIAQIVASARDIDVYIHTALGSAGADLFQSGNKLTDAISGNFSIGEKLNPRWVHNTDFDSYKDLVETAAELTMSYRSEFNAQARAIFDLIASNPLRYVGIRITGPIIEGAIPYVFEIAAACNITGAEEEDADGVYAYKFDFTPRYDATLTSAFWIRVV
ncbi:MAG: hypothetical protein AB7P97_21530, partial [Hyphomonadaceae bacterium]